MFEQLTEQAYAAASELIDKAKMSRGQILAVGCSSSEVCGGSIGHDSNLEAAEAVFAGISKAAGEHGLYLAAQCCEHLNRAIIVEREAVPGAYIVNVVPQPKAGGAFATAAYRAFADPVALEGIAADAALDIGDVRIGMQVRPVAVPVRLSNNTIGNARVVAARSRARFIGGVRAVYDETML